MINVMRKHHKVLMIVITGLVCISFSWYWNKTDFAQMGQGTVGRIYDRNVSELEFQRDSRLLRLGAELGMRDLIGALTAGAQTENEAFQNFSWNLMVLRHEADALGIQPTTQEIANAVKTLPAFQGPNGFELDKYTNFSDRALAPMGFSEAQVEELAANQIALQRVKKLLAAGVAVPEAEMRSNYEQLYGKMDVSVVHFRSGDFASEVQVSDDDIAKYFEVHKAELKTDEKRQVKFVTFALTEEQKKLSGKPRIDVLQKLADKANEFTDALQVKGADFNQTAAKFQMTAKQTGEFTKAAPDPQLAGAAQVAEAAFNLTSDSPNSDAVQTADGFYIEHLVKIDPARPLSVEEARAKIVEALTKERLQALVAAKAGEAAQKLREAIKAGKSPEEAAAQAGLKAEKIPSFALLDRPPGDAPSATPAPKKDDPDMPYIRQAVGDLKPGEVSDFVRKPDGGLLVVLEKREPIDPKQYEAAHATLQSRTLEGKSDVVFFEWLRERRHAAGVQETKAAEAQPAPG